MYWMKYMIQTIKMKIDDYWYCIEKTKDKAYLNKSQDFLKKSSKKIKKKKKRKKAD